MSPHKLRWIIPAAVVILAVTVAIALSPKHDEYEALFSMHPKRSVVAEGTARLDVFDFVQREHDTRSALAKLKGWSISGSTVLSPSGSGGIESLEPKVGPGAVVEVYGSQSIVGPGFSIEMPEPAEGMKTRLFIYHSRSWMERQIDALKRILHLP